MSESNKSLPGVRERAAKMVQEQRGEDASLAAAIDRAEDKLCGAEAAGVGQAG